MIINWTRRPDTSTFPIWNWSSLGVAGIGPLCIQAVQVFEGGQSEVQAFEAGHGSPDVYDAGRSASQIDCT